MAKHTIKLKKYSDVIEEYTAATVITPGMLLQPVPGATTIRAHAVAGGGVLPMFALEDELQGKEIDDNYIVGDKVQVWIPYRGDMVNALLRDEENIAIGDFLESDGEGRLRKWAGDSDEIPVLPIVGQAVEAVNLSVLPEGSESSAGGLYHNPRIQVRIV